MIDAERMLGSLVRSAMGGGRRRGRRRRRRSWMGSAAKGALGLGALGVAVAAFEHFSKQSGSASKFTGGTPAAPPGGAPPPPPPGPRAASAPPPPPPGAVASPAAAGAGGREEATLLVRAMIAAANADHELDEEERRRILEALEEADASEEDKAFLRGELENPIGLAALAAEATTPELASQVYLASCLAIEVDTRAERAYLDRLAERLGLAPERAAELESMTA